MSPRAPVSHVSFHPLSSHGLASIGLRLLRPLTASPPLVSVCSVFSRPRLHWSPSALSSHVLASIGLRLCVCECQSDFMPQPAHCMLEPEELLEVVCSSFSRASSQRRTFLCRFVTDLDFNFQAKPILKHCLAGILVYSVDPRMSSDSQGALLSASFHAVQWTEVNNDNMCKF